MLTEPILVTLHIVERAEKMMTAFRQYLYTAQVGRIGMLNNPTEEEKQMVEEHKAYLENLTEEGIGIFGGGVKDINDSRHLGLFVYQAEDDIAAREIINNDPAVKEHMMRGCLYPFQIALWNGDAIQLGEGQTHYLYHIQAIRPEQVIDATAWETEITMQHFRYLKEQTEKGNFCIVGRTQNSDYSTFGMGVLRASSEAEAWQISKNDPGVANSVMRLDVLPFDVAIYNGDWDLE